MVEKREINFDDEEILQILKLCRTKSSKLCEQCKLRFKCYTFRESEENGHDSRA